MEFVTNYHEIFYSVDVRNQHPISPKEKIMQHCKPLPPFGKLLESFLQFPIKLKSVIYLFVGKNSYNDAREVAQQFTPVLALPPDKTINDFKWPIVGQKVIIIDSGIIDSKDLRIYALELLNLGAKTVAIHSENFFDIYNA